jgi:hypothetical protein
MNNERETTIRNATRFGDIGKGSGIANWTALA